MGTEHGSFIFIVTSSIENSNAWCEDDVIRLIVLTPGGLRCIDRFCFHKYLVRRSINVNNIRVELDAVRVVFDFVLHNLIRNTSAIRWRCTSAGKEEILVFEVRVGIQWIVPETNLFAGKKNLYEWGLSVKSSLKL